MRPSRCSRRAARKIQVPIDGEWIGERLNGRQPQRHDPTAPARPASSLPAASLDAVFTDPPYFGNVQYGELMDFCYVWLRRLVGHEAEGFDRESSRGPSELTVNETQGRDLNISPRPAAVYATWRGPEARRPLAFTYHHNKLEAYQAIGVAILDAG